ncbi:MAG: hypothetical protein QM783_07545 [Phycisphaerales bacterium]
MFGGFERGFDGDAAGLGELDGVADEVDQDLAEADGVGVDRLGDGRDDAGGEAEALAAGLDVHERQYVLQDAVSGGGEVFHRHATGLDLGDVEDVVDDREQVLAVAVDGVDALEALAGCKGAVAVVSEEFGKAQDGGHGRADLVAHVGQELALGATGGFGLGFGDAQCGVGGVEVRGLLTQEALALHAAVEDALEGDVKERAGEDQHEDGSEVADGAEPAGGGCVLPLLCGEVDAEHGFDVADFVAQGDERGDPGAPAVGLGHIHEDGLAGEGAVELLDRLLVRLADRGALLAVLVDTAVVVVVGLGVDDQAPGAFVVAPERVDVGDAWVGGEPAFFVLDELEVERVVGLGV